MLTRQDLERIEQETLAPYAALSVESRGRDHRAEPCPMRTEYQRDRDRVIHCAAFRKLEYKTQVYVAHVGDYHRTRLTHTMEVSQIARTFARSLRLNADLTEAIALAHDLGHTPFGHSGEAALHRLMADHGGFEHNRQGIRVVELLEERYRGFPGLNLTWEVREGIAKHTTVYDSPDNGRFDPHLAPPLEAQLVDVADEIAFYHHDLDDALKMGILTRGDLRSVGWVDEICRREEAQNPGSAYGEDRFVRVRLISQMIDVAVRDVLDRFERNIAEARVGSIDDVRRAGRRLVEFSPEATERYRELREFLFENVYRHPTVVRYSAKAVRFIERLFGLYKSTPGQLPIKFQARIEAEGLERVIADYISGMTDRYCTDEYARSFLP
ncbi:deoxyguanosinetriphosphate triphosphohydrolase [Candidatus Sumerlaeota bacterium]|nr:deoxyguanosinetriphosphate triphosphohydrolase [Candidatus Sumerlaeota bacterium]